METPWVKSFPPEIVFRIVSDPRMRRLNSECRDYYDHHAVLVLDDDISTSGLLSRLEYLLECQKRGVEVKTSWGFSSQAIPVLQRFATPRRVAIESVRMGIVSKCPRHLGSEVDRETSSYIKSHLGKSDLTNLAMACLLGYRSWNESSEKVIEGSIKHLSAIPGIYQMWSEKPHVGDAEFCYYNRIALAILGATAYFKDSGSKARDMFSPTSLARYDLAMAHVLRCWIQHGTNEVPWETVKGIVDTPLVTLHNGFSHANLRTVVMFIIYKHWQPASRNELVALTRTKMEHIPTKQRYYTTDIVIWFPTLRADTYGAPSKRAKPNPM